MPDCTGVDFSDYYNKQIRKAINKINRLENRLTDPFDDFKTLVSGLGSGTASNTFQNALGDLSLSNMNIPEDPFNLGECIADQLQDCINKPISMILNNIDDMVNNGLDRISSIASLPEKQIAQSANEIRKLIKKFGIEGQIFKWDNLINCGLDQSNNISIANTLMTSMNSFLENFAMFDNGVFDIRSLMNQAMG